MSESSGTPSPEWEEMADKVKSATGPHRMVMIGAAVLLIDSFLPWFGVNLFGVSVTGNGWQEGSVGLGIALILAAGVLSLLKVLGKDITVPPVLQLVLAIAGTALILLKALGNLEFLQIGAYIGAVAAGVVVYGAWKLRQA
jgi:hypothetical protein